MSGWLNYLVDSLAFGATFIYGSTGEILTEKAGHLNLGIPGIMCMGGAGGAWIMYLIGSSALPPFLIVLLGTLAALVFGAVTGAIHSFLTITLRANQNVTGLALTIFGEGMMKVILDGQKLTNKAYLVQPVSYFHWPFAGRNDSLQLIGPLFFLAIIIAVLSSWVLMRTKVGLHLRAVGENPATADAAGINVTGYKYAATCIGSGIAGLGGFYYIVDYMGNNEAYLDIPSYGWLSIALVIFALWRPVLAIVGSTVFGFLFSLSSLIKISTATQPLMQMLPYVVTILVLIVTSIRNKRENQPPSSLGLSYFREDR